MNVIFVSHYVDLYGANRSLLNLIEGLRQFDIQSYVIVPSIGPLTVELEKLSVPYYVPPMPLEWWMGRPSVFFRAKAIRRLVVNITILPFVINRVRRWKADVIYTNSSVTPLGILVATFVKKHHIWHVREFGEQDYGLRHDWGSRVFNYFLNQSAAVIAVSKSIATTVLDKATIPKHIVYNGVASRNRIPNLDDLVTQVNSSEHSYIFAILGVLTPNKGQEHAIRAVATLKDQYPHIQLLIAGQGSETHYIDELKALCHLLKITEHVQFLGYGTDPFSVYQRAHAVLMCSSHEAMGRVTAEAMINARPVIGFRNAGTTEIIEHEVTGLLYDGGYRELAQCMERFINDSNWAKQLGINGWNKARNEFVTEVYSERIFSVLQKVAADRVSQHLSNYDYWGRTPNSHCVDDCGESAHYRPVC